MSPNMPSDSERDGYFTNLCLSGLIYLKPDICRLTTLFFLSKDSDISTLLWVLDQLKRLANAESHPKSKYFYYCIYRWKNGRAAGWGSCNITCQSSDHITMTALSQGLYECWPAGEIDEVVCDVILHEIQTSLMSYHISRGSGFDDEVPSFDRLLRSLTCCLASGTSANAPIHHSNIIQPKVNVWHNLIWHSIWTSKFTAPHGPVWLLFLLHGADTNFWLTFERSPDDGATEENGSKLLSVIGQFGAGKHQPYLPLMIHENHGGIVDIAKAQDWSVSLKDIVSFWFPAQAHVFRRLIDLNETAIGKHSPEDLKGLRREYGFDLESWQPQEWGISEPLFKSWTGISQILDWERQYNEDSD